MEMFAPVFAVVLKELTLILATLLEKVFENIVEKGKSYR